MRSGGNTIREREAYVLNRVGDSKGFLVNGLVFRSVDTGVDVLIKPGRALLTRVPPGRDCVRRVDLAVDNPNTSSDPQPEAPSTHI